MDDNNSFRVFIKTINMIISIKNLDFEELDKIFSAVKSKVDRLLYSEVTTYHKVICNFFLEDIGLMSEISEEVKDEEDLVEIYEDIYHGVIRCYPNFQLEVVCESLNLDKSTPETIEEGKVDTKKSLDTKKKKKPRSQKDISLMDAYLKRKVVGQDKAINSLVEVSKLIYSNLYKSATMFFYGSTGSGKSYLSELFGKRYSGRYKKFNCGEFALSQEKARLVGSPPGYIGSQEPGELSKLASEGNDWVVVFDEIEKAHPSFYKILLTLLDTGEITDSQGNNLDFTNSVFIFTSNTGVSDEITDKLGFGGQGGIDNLDQNKGNLLLAIKKLFPEEFQNRIDEWIYFPTLSKKDIKKIISLELGKIPVKKTPALIDYILEKGYNKTYGARNIKRFIKKNIAIKIADRILNNEIPMVGNLYSATYSGREGIIIRNTRQRHGTNKEREENELDL